MTVANRIALRGLALPLALLGVVLFAGPTQAQIRHIPSNPGIRPPVSNPPRINSPANPGIGNPGMNPPAFPSNPAIPNPPAFPNPPAVPNIPAMPNNPAFPNNPGFPNMNQNPFANQPMPNFKQGEAARREAEEAVNTAGGVTIAMGIGMILFGTLVLCGVGFMALQSQRSR